MKTQILHNPHCSKSRHTLDLLKTKTDDIEIIEYLNGELDEAQLDAILNKLGMEPVEIIRSKEKDFKEQGLSISDQRSREEWIRILIENPRFIERPIVIKGENAIMGRPPENVFNLFAPHKKKGRL